MSAPAKPAVGMAQLQQQEQTGKLEWKSGPEINQTLTFSDERLPRTLLPSLTSPPDPSEAVKGPVDYSSAHFLSCSHGFGIAMTDVCFLFKYT